MNIDNLIEYKVTVWGQTGLDFVCYLEFHPASGDGVNEPFYAETVELVYALKDGCNIYEVLGSRVIEWIEKDYLKSIKQ